MINKQLKGYISWLSKRLTCKNVKVQDASQNRSYVFKMRILCTVHIKNNFL